MRKGRYRSYSLSLILRKSLFFQQKSAPGITKEPDFSLSPVLPFDVTAAAVLERLWTQRLRIGRMDLRIASIALSREMVLVTRNVSDFSKVPDLQIEDWTI